MGVWLDGFSRDGMRVAPFANRSPFKLVVKATAPDSNIENLLDQFDQRLENFEELILLIESCAPRISRTVIGNEQELPSSIKSFDRI